MYAKALTYKSNSFLIYLVKISIIALSLYFIYSKLAHNDSLSFTVFLDTLNSSAVFKVKTIAMLLFLSCLNWLFEILKWKLLVQTFQDISFKKATEQSLGAHTASLFTPNRIGDYGAKALYAPPNLRRKTMGLNGIGNFMQMCATTFFGCIGLILFTLKFPLKFSFKTLHWSYYIFLGLISLSLYFLIKSYVKPKNWVLKTKQFLKSISNSTLLKTLLFSIFRYLIFSFQFYVLLQIFQTDLGYLNTMMVISSMYLLASILPSLFIFDVVLKGSIAIYLFSFFNINETIVLSCITLMWIFNVVLPSLLGSYFVLNFKLLKA